MINKFPAFCLLGLTVFLLVGCNSASNTGADSKQTGQDGKTAVTAAGSATTSIGNDDTSTGQPPINKALTLEQAQKWVPFPIVTPKNPPHGMKLADAMIDYPPEQVKNDKLKGVILNYSSPDHQYGMVVRENRAGGHMGGSVTKTTINGKEAEISRNDHLPSMILFYKGDVFISIEAGTTLATSDQALFDLAKAF